MFRFSKLKKRIDSQSTDDLLLLLKQMGFLQSVREPRLDSYLIRFWFGDPHHCNKKEARTMAKAMLYSAMKSDFDSVNEAIDQL